ncbi:MAG: DUF2384 domain-containing protein [Solirubrobacterales bacterium]|nr:DUF2384 domain-containing protein [Solirubrobacterales bacterium]
MTLTEVGQSETTFAGRLAAAALGSGVGLVDLERLLPVSERTLRRWLDGETNPRPRDRERALEVIVVLEELARVFKPEGAAIWLFAPNPAFDFAKPADLLTEGRYLEVIGAIEAMGEGVFV